MIYGSGSGLSATFTPDQLWHQGSPGIEDFPEEFDYFGQSLGAEDFNSDGYDDLVIGAPDESVGTLFAAGSANVIYGSSIRFGTIQHIIYL